MNLIDFVATAPQFPNAACIGIEDPDVFFVEDKRLMAKAAPALREICMSCIHRIECRDYAVREQIEFGFWGGTTPEERKELAPKPKKRKRRSSKGFRAAQLRAQGMRWTEIGSELSLSPAAAQKAWVRYMEDQRAAS